MTTMPPTHDTTTPRARPNPSGLRTHTGSCHCGAVRFEATLDLDQGATRCNCSICGRLGAASVRLKPEAFRLLQGAENVGEYRVGENAPAHRAFCRTCGIYVFGAGDLEVLGGPFVTVNVNCLEEVDHSSLRIGYWDGRHDNWMAGMREVPWPNVRG